MTNFEYMRNRLLERKGLLIDQPAAKITAEQLNSMSEWSGNHPNRHFRSIDEHSLR